jgi:hypothetical protein
MATSSRSILKHDRQRCEPVFARGNIEKRLARGSWLAGDLRSLRFEQEPSSLVAGQYRLRHSISLRVANKVRRDAHAVMAAIPTACTASIR